MKNSYLSGKLSFINKNIQKNYSLEPNIGVLTGISGSSLFLEYYNRYISKNEQIISTEEIYNLSIEKINDGYQLPTHCEGINGFIWTLFFLQNNNFITQLEDDIFIMLDGYIKEWCHFSIKQNNFDFLHGSAGCILYFINKFKTTKETQKKEFEVLINLFIDGLSTKLKEIIEYRDSKKYQDFQNRTFLGLAHGIAAFISILGKLSFISRFQKQSLYLINQYVLFLLDISRSSINKASLFPSWITPSTDLNKVKSSLSWCTGDLGIGIALLNTAENIQDNNLKNIAFEILVHSSKRITSEKSGLQDPCICHGYFGAYKVFSRAYTITNEKIFLDAKQYWLKIGLESIIGKISSNLSILNGQAGIGLALIDAYTDEDHNWGECLLIS